MIGARKARIAPALAVIAALTLGSCRDAVPPDAVAQIGDVTLLYNADFQDYLRENGADSGDLPDSVLAVLFRRFLDERLLAQWAVDSQWVAPGESTRRILEVLLTRFPPPEPSMADIERFYAANPSRFARGARVRIRQLLCSDRATAVAARDALRSGERFEALLRRLERSDGRGVLPGGDLGALEREDLPPEFADLLFRMKPGEISDVLEAAQGFHVVEILALEPPAVETVEQASEEIRAELDRRAADETLRKLVADARGHYDVVVYEKNLPFPPSLQDEPSSDSR